MAACPWLSSSLGPASLAQAPKHAWHWLGFTLSAGRNELARLQYGACLPLSRVLYDCCAGLWLWLQQGFTRVRARSQFKSRSGGKGFPLSYPCCVLNVMVAKHNTNEQYAELVDPAAKTYATSSRMSIEFEVDGPYRVRPRQASAMLFVQDDPQLAAHATTSCAWCKETLTCKGHTSF